MKENKVVQKKPEFLLYQSKDGQIKVETRLENETIWLTLNQIAELFQVDISGISRHLKNIYETGELTKQGTLAKIATVRFEADREVTRMLDYYNLDAIISVGYRVNSLRGTHFRQWATQRLKEYIIKGFTMDDDRLKESGGGFYFDELLARIRDIRSSEKIFWRKILDIYATSIDYDPRADVSRDFFKVIQNKMHWASHGHTAAEIIYERVDASKPNMGLTSWSGDNLRKTDIEIAKNYLDEDELNILNRIVTMYLDFAELQALNRKPMYMKNWIVKLDEFLKLSGREILDNAGTIAHEEALQKANLEYEKWHKEQLQKPTNIEKHFIESIDSLNKIEQIKKK